MKYCPKCGCEYLEDIEVCGDCDADLINEPPPEIPEEYLDVEWVELHTFQGTLYAQMAVEMLNREGIPAYSQSLGGTAVYGVLGGADLLGSNATVWVLEPDLERAEDIIEPMTDEILGRPDDEYEE